MEPEMLVSTRPPGGSRPATPRHRPGATSAHHEHPAHEEHRHPGAPRQGHHQGPHQVELLLGGQRPGEVEDDALVRGRLDEPVGRVGEEGRQVGEEVPAHHRVLLGEEHQRDVEAEHRVVEREDAQRAPGEEAAQRDVPRLVALAQQQRGDEEAADGEEERHAQVAPADQPLAGLPHVVEHHGEDGERSQPVQGSEGLGAKKGLMGGFGGVHGHLPATQNSQAATRAAEGAPRPYR